jgi:ferric-dicitrate binding protein FerR (iron transport regulator)
MTISDSDSLWLRHLAGERLQPWEEQRLLRFLEEDPELKDAFLRDHEMDGMLRALDRARREEKGFLREVRSLVEAEKDRTRFVSRFRERMKREGSGRFLRANTTRRIPRVAAPPSSSPAPRIVLIAAEFLVGAFLLWAALSSSPERAKPAPQVRRTPVEDAPEVRQAPPLDWAPARRPEPAASEPAAPSELRPAPLLPSVPPMETPRAVADRHETVPALAIVERIQGDVYVRNPRGMAPAKPGHSLMPGEGLVSVGPKSGASVKYADDTRFQIRGDTIIRELAEGPGKRIVLSQGSFATSVSHQPAEAPMEILTPVARITVVGTRFSVACGLEATRVTVDEGRVRLTSLARSETVDAVAGEVAGATAGRLWSARPLRTYPQPSDWKGMKSESAQGNPYRVDSRPTWRLDQIWPDDPTKVENYSPLVWNGLFWRASEQSSGGQPSAEVSENGIGLGVRMWWPDQLGSKIASLAFVAPVDGVYALEGGVRTDIWEGGTLKPLLLQVMKMDRKEKQITELASVAVTTPELLELQDLLVPLKAQQELIFLPRLPERSHVACTYVFEGLKVHRVAWKP